MSKIKHLLDVNILIALTEKDHMHHSVAMRWFNAMGLDWGLCPFTEAGFLRLSSNARIGKLTVAQASTLLERLAHHPGYRFWPVSAGWNRVAAPFLGRIVGSQQITDAYLLGLAVQEDGVLVTFDKAILHLAGPEYRRHVLVLSS